MITRKVNLAFVSGLDLIYIHKPYSLSHTPTHGQNFFFRTATVSQETLVILFFNIGLGLSICLFVTLGYSQEQVEVGF